MIRPTYLYRVQQIYLIDQLHQIYQIHKVPEVYRIHQFCSPSSRLKKGKRFEGMCSTKTIYKCASSAQRQMCIHFLGNENCICLKSGLASYRSIFFSGLPEENNQIFGLQKIFLGNFGSENFALQSLH